MKSIRNKIKRALAGAALVVLAAAGFGCPKVKPPVDGPVVETDPARFIERLQRRAAAVTRMDARLEVNLKGAGGPFQGQFYGSFLAERRGNELATSMQIYTVLGLPALEVITIGDRFEVFSPLDGTIYFNFPDLAPAKDVEPLPLSAFSDIVVPLEMIQKQVLLLFGLGFSPDYQYQLKLENDRYNLSEWQDGQLRREIFYGMRGPDLAGVKLYDQGAEAGSMDCSDHFTYPAAAGFLPSKVEIRQGAVGVSLNLSRARLNNQVPGAEISFRAPKDERLILLTPDPPESDRN